MKVALVHDYLYDYGGAEKVLEALHEIWPQAPVYTAWVDWDWVEKNKKDWLTWKIIPSWFDKFPFKKNLCSPLRFLAPWIWESFDLRVFDLVISSSAWYMCKGVITHPGTSHICYCHTPPRYLYGYPESIGKKNWLIRLYATIVNPYMRYWDFVSSQRVDYFIANSENVKKRIEKFYRRDAKVIYPPITIKKPLINGTTRLRQGYGGRVKQSNNDYYLMVNRLVWHKRVDLAIKACKKLGLTLKIVGEGKVKRELEELAGDDPRIQFLGYSDDEELASLYRGCKAVLYLAQEEDFGITPVEAMAWGRPVIAFKSGGVTESVIGGKTGIFVEKPTVEAVTQVLKQFNDSNNLTVNPAACRKQAEKFSRERFTKEIKEFVNQACP